MHGTSLLRVIEDGAQVHEDLYYDYYELGPFGVPAHDEIRTQRYKLVHFYRNGDFNLFDLKKDPMNLVSFHDDPAYSSRNTLALNQSTRLPASRRDGLKNFASHASVD